MSSRARFAFWGILAAQLLVPAIQLTAERPSRFGWHMYSAIGAPASFGVVVADTRTDTIRAEEILVKLRPEIDLASVIPPYLCRKYPEAIAVQIYPAMNPEAVREIPCPSQPVAP